METTNTNNMASNTIEEPTMFGVIEKLNEEYEELQAKYKRMEELAKWNATKCKNFQIKSFVWEYFLPRFMNNETDFDINILMNEECWNMLEVEHLEQCSDIICKFYLETRSLGNPISLNNEEVKLYLNNIYEIFFHMTPTQRILCPDIPYHNITTGYDICNENHMRDTYVQFWLENREYARSQEIYDSAYEEPPNREENMEDIKEWLEYNNEWIIVYLPLDMFLINDRSQ